MSMLSTEDTEICRQVSKGLMSDLYKQNNYLFLYPFDLSETPGYMDVVSKLMDLSTLASNLDSGVYKNRDDFYSDSKVIFENAIAYHKNRPASKWLVKPAKEMLRAFERERIKAEKNVLGPSPKSASSSTTTTTTTSGKMSKGGLLLPTKKNKLKLKLGGASSSEAGNSASAAAAAAAAAAVAAPAPPAPKSKVSIKLKAPSQGKQAPPGVEQVAASAAVAAETKKPRLTLKLGKSKGPEESSVAASNPSTPATATTTPTTTESKASTTKGNKISLKVMGSGGSRGKELPKGVTPDPPPKKKTTSKASSSTKPTVTKAAAGTKAKASTSKTSKVKAKITLKTPPPAQPAAAAGAAASSAVRVPSLSSSSSSLMTPARKAQCAKVLTGLKRREHKAIGWFLQPVSDKAIVQDYRAKIPNPMDVSTMQTKLTDKNDYATIASFVLDLRRIYSNCLRYNTSIKDSLRPVAARGLETVEKLLTVFLAKPESPTQVYPPLLFCWKLCLSALDTLYNLTNPEDGQMTAYYFLYPVSFYCGGQFPPDYLEKITKPMDYGTVTSNLIEGRYSTLAEFEADCKLVLENCITYYGGQPDGKLFTDQASRLKAVLQTQLDGLNRYVKSSKGQTQQREAQMAVATVHLPKPPIPLLLSILEEMKSLKYTDKMTKITEPAMGPFEKPVSLAAFPDYAQHITSPMDLQTVERKVKAAAYSTPEDFEYDMQLIFQNCITYNSIRKADHLVSMGRYSLKNFRKIFSAKMKPFDDPTSVTAVSPPKAAAVPAEITSVAPAITAAVRKDAPSGGAQQGAAKKLKIDVSRGAKVVSGPRITLSASAAVAAAARPKTPTPKTTVPKSKPNQPVPLHIAIAQVKEQFPLRRAVKSLQSWEAGCARFFKEMMRHSWISAARPKFIFHVPVPVLFPELREAYSAKIKKPMDLTTVECALLAGNKYTSPEDFVNDLALVFSNAIIFNKDGRDVGDPLSCAYYDASIHLLRYCRWLSLELLSEYVDDSDYVDEPEDATLPLTSWKLTSGNRKKAREEMESIVLKEPIERSLEGDRYTWMEAECEKLLKALRHQSDLRYMTFFIQPNYPADYAAFISKPMDWERVQKTLKKRHYDKFGDVIDDLRLIFTNALKYNARHAGTESVSGRAYDSAKYMSAKLEAAINKMMLAVSDRVERERIDHNNAEREIEAAERAEEERIRAQWKNENPDKEGGPSLPLRIESSQRIRSTKRASLRREQADFEVPFFDEEDNGQHETSYFEVVRQQKAIFERQRQERAKMMQATSSLGAALFLRLSQRDLALKWVEEERKKLGIPSQGQSKKSDSSQQKTGERVVSSSTAAASEVLQKLDEKGRTPFQLKLSKPKPKLKGKKQWQPPIADFGDDDSDL